MDSSFIFTLHLIEIKLNWTCEEYNKSLLKRAYFSNYLVPGWDGGQNDVILTEFKKLMPSSYDILQGGAVLHMITLG